MFPNKETTKKILTLPELLKGKVQNPTHIQIYYLAIKKRSQF
jgi:hypothetical protein